MATYPTSPRIEFLQWCQEHADTFVDNAAAIGVNPADAEAFSSLTDGTAAAETTQGQAQQAAKVATQQVNQSYDQLRTAAGDIVRSIRAYAELQADPNAVYNTAQIAPPAPPTPAPPPAQPTDLTVALEPQTGELMLMWKATNPTGTQGTSYIIRRKLPGESEFSFVGVSGKKKFVDSTLYAGPDTVQYTVQGQRSDLAGPVSQVFLVSFGRLPDGGMTAYVGASAAGASIPTKSAVAPSSNGVKANGLSRMGV